MAETPFHPIRVIQFNSVFNGLGTDNLTMDLARGLKEDGHEVSIAASERSALIPRAREFGLNVEGLPEKGPLKLPMIRGLAAMIRRTGAQIVHAHQGRDYWPAILAARLARVRTNVVVTRHLMLQPRFLTRNFLLWTSDAVAVSQAVLRVLSKELRGPRSHLHLIYGGIDTQLFSPGSAKEIAEIRAKRQWPADAIVFGIVGSYNLPRGKGHLELLQATARLKKQVPNVRLVMIGNGTMKDLLQKEIAQLGLEGSVEMTGFSREVSDAIKALDVLVHPAVGSEALGLAIMEALACGIPVIGSNLDGIPEAIYHGKNGLLVPPGDVAALSEAMYQLGSEPLLRRQMGMAGRAIAEQNFTRELYARNTAALYRTILERTRR